MGRAEGGLGSKCQSLVGPGVQFGCLMRECVMAVEVCGYVNPSLIQMLLF